MDDTLSGEREDGRLESLRALGILDTAPEPAFDDIVEIAAALCSTPMALVSLVDSDRQWFKARIGVDLEQTPIEQAVCAYAIRQRDVFVIPDLTRDPRTRDNPLVTAEGGIRFYAGAPLLTSDGHAIGTLCVIDDKPRPGGLTTAQASSLQALARQVVTLIQTRQKVDDQSASLRRFVRDDADARARLRSSEQRGAALEVSDTRSRSAQEAARIGTFELDIASDSAEVSAEFCRLFGLPIAESYTFAFLEQFVIKGEGARHSTRETRRDGSAKLDVEYSIRRADDGELRWLARRAAFHRGADGRVTRMYGTIQDVTERRLAADRVAALLRLGDRLRELDEIDPIVATASEILCETLQASRCGYAAVDLPAGMFKVGGDWARGVASVVGEYPVATFAATLARLRDRGGTIADPDIERVVSIAPDIEGYRAMATRSQIQVPLSERGQLVGVLFVQDQSPRTWDEAEIRFAESVADRTYAAIAKARAEADRELVSAELGHRLKNMLAMIQAIARQTLRKVPERAPVEAFESRLLALGAAHDVLINESWTSARINELVANTVAMLGQSGRITATGPNLSLGTRAALGLSLLLHELATNAVKYGALSTEQGRVELSWAIESDSGQTFRFAWQELGGPPVVEPARKGFGSRLIYLGLMGTGSADVRYVHSGLEAVFTAPLAAIRGE